MKLMHVMLGCVVGCVLVVTGCEKKPVAAGGGKVSGASDHGHDHGPGEGHAQGEHGKVIELGEQEVGEFAVNVTRDEGTIVAGKDAPIDVRVSAKGKVKVGSVRFWIGLQDGKGSVKAKGEIEDPKEPNRWHAHAEIPNPIPAGSKLWVEIAPETGEKVVVGFELRM